MKSRLVSLVAAATLAAGVLAATPALADPPPVEDRVVVTTVSSGQNPNENTVITAAFGLSQNGTKVQPNIAVHITINSCGRLVTELDAVTKSDAGGVGLWFTENESARIGKSYEYALDITQPGYDTYQLTGSYSGYTVKRPTCEQILAAGNPPAGCKVETFSKKVAVAGVGKRAVVGHKVKVSKTRAPDCKVSYKWTANGRKVGTGTTLRVGDGLKGKTLSAVVTVGKGQAKKTKVLSYGRVASART